MASSSGLKRRILAEESQVKKITKITRDRRDRIARMPVLLPGYSREHAAALVWMVGDLYHGQAYLMKQKLEEEKNEDAVLEGTGITFCLDNMKDVWIKIEPRLREDWKSAILPNMLDPDMMIAQVQSTLESTTNHLTDGNSARGSAQSGFDGSENGICRLSTCNTDASYNREAAEFTPSGLKPSHPNPTDLHLSEITSHSRVSSDINPCGVDYSRLDTCNPPARSTALNALRPTVHFELPNIGEEDVTHPLGLSIMQAPARISSRCCKGQTFWENRI